MFSSLLVSATLLASTLAAQKYVLITSHSGDGEFHLRPVYVGPTDSLTLDNGVPATVSFEDDKLIVYTSSYPDGKYAHLAQDGSIVLGDSSDASAFSYKGEGSNGVLQWSDNDQSGFFGCPGDQTARIFATGYPSLCTDPHSFEILAFAAANPSKTTSSPLASATSAVL